MAAEVKNIDQLRDLATSDDCFVTTIALMAVSKLGLECLDWDPEVVLSEFESSYGISRLPSRSCDKLQTGLTIIGTDAFTSTLEGFLAATKVMNNHIFSSMEVPYCDLRMCSWSVCEYLQLMEDSGDMAKVEFSPEIKIYIQKVGGVHGITKFPQWLSFADSDGVMPDMTGDVDLFEMYNQRQSDYDDILVAEAEQKQLKLGAQLSILKQAKILSKPA